MSISQSLGPGASLAPSWWVGKSFSTWADAMEAELRIQTPESESLVPSLSKEPTRTYPSPLQWYDLRKITLFPEPSLLKELITEAPS